VAAAEHHAVPNEEATVETTGALEDWSGDQQTGCGILEPMEKVD
jgi:hypothetical protein